MSKMINVIPNEDYTLLIELDNQHKIIYDFKPRLQTVRFCSLEAIERFKKVEVRYGHTLYWSDFCQISLDEILEMIKK
ncbi:DUF2442 domain-containing protein [Fusibacter ferrireducens]|uniref:DUF2442 domain-containing protein n=1 Tax=Fusibacter ferrireducens TaxID=2785058 RepID=A0ABR9ZYD0_9FIRM|nr:DUF2442 domain-containing protein [Fusibacter ferrireducens]MBF4695459.1 DUF2442 domain-containing protein [Fusibacter ferrireducens]